LIAPEQGNLEAGEEIKNRIGGTIPMGRIGEADEIGKAGFQP
jgi:hypothetical protein